MRDPRSVSIASLCKRPFLLLILHVQFSLSLPPPPHGVGQAPAAGPTEVPIQFLRGIPAESGCELLRIGLSLRLRGGDTASLRLRPMQTARRSEIDPDREQSRRRNLLASLDLVDDESDASDFPAIDASDVYSRRVALNETEAQGTDMARFSRVEASTHEPASVSRATPANGGAVYSNRLGKGLLCHAPPLFDSNHHVAAVTKDLLRGGPPRTHALALLTGLVEGGSTSSGNRRGDTRRGRSYIALEKFGRSLVAILLEPRSPNSALSEDAYAHAEALYRSDRLMAMRTLRVWLQQCAHGSKVADDIMDGLRYLFSSSPDITIEWKVP